MYIPLSDDKHQMVQDSSKKPTGQCGRNSNPVATLPHAAVVFRMQPFNLCIPSGGSRISRRWGRGPIGGWTPNAGTFH